MRDTGATWSTWTPSSDANIEFRWQVDTIITTMGKTRQTFPVQIYFVQQLGGPSPAPSRRRRTQIPADSLQNLFSLVAEATLSPSEPTLPFSLFSPNDPKRLFSGTLKAIYPKKNTGATQEPPDESSDTDPTDDDGARATDDSESAGEAADAAEREGESAGVESRKADEDPEDDTVRLVVENLIFRPGPDVPMHQFEPSLSPE